MQAKITFLVNEEGATIELYDPESTITFAEIKLTAGQLCQALSRLARTECEMELHGLDRIGKKMLIDHISFPMPECNYKEEKAIAYEEAVRLCPARWEVDSYFGSKNNFFWDKDGVRHARATIRRWISVEEENNE